MNGIAMKGLLITLLVDRVKTKVQTRALAGERKRGVWETFRRLVRGTYLWCLLVTALVMLTLHACLT